MSSSTAGNNELRCNKCGITFTTVQDKEEHMKLEHKESKDPAGVK
jgi:tRNA(Ile2) C34 agmatinyltransferase TiaS